MEFRYQIERCQHEIALNGNTECRLRTATNCLVAAIGDVSFGEDLFKNWLTCFASQLRSGLPITNCLLYPTVWTPNLGAASYLGDGEWESEGPYSTAQK